MVLSALRMNPSKVRRCREKPRCPGYCDPRYGLPKEVSPVGHRGWCFEVVVESLGKDFIRSGYLSTVSPSDVRRAH